MTADAGLADRLKAEARRAGFDLVGIAPAVAPPGHGRYLDWLERGHAAGMGYLERHAAPKVHPRHVLEGVRSVVMVGLIYGHPAPGPTGPTGGKVARYARGGDYHEILWRKLGELLDWLRAESPGVVGRAVADTAPLLERDFAQMAGLGWIGKNTCLIDRRAGSFTVLGALLVDLPLRYDEPLAANHCGTCTRCLDACPTDALVAPYQLDARRCISYWTIEHKGPIPDEAAGSLGDWAFGCDICQDVCPWNRKAPPGREPGLDARPEWEDPDLIDWLDAEPAAFARSLKGTALARTKRSGMVRNAALVLGGKRLPAAVPSLIARLGDADPVVRGASAWALGRIGDASAAPALLLAAGDPDPAARTSILAALEALGIASGGAP
ncbi:tRNA epoxyqueuosine(34) reductase QueG [Tundrisphaera sp. TA3]|uniref:tRNA epoxyqueuosine(34) reductase QueG n=1 Tax=Tundrisphaera sp. TA3 TaxID=3435775 RepID=UPI003EBBE4F8